MTRRWHKDKRYGTLQKAADVDTLGAERWGGWKMKMERCREKPMLRGESGKVFYFWTINIKNIWKTDDAQTFNVVSPQNLFLVSRQTGGCKNISVLAWKGLWEMSWHWFDRTVGAMQLTSLLRAQGPASRSESLQSGEGFTNHLWQLLHKLSRDLN